MEEAHLTIALKESCLDLTHMFSVLLTHLNERLLFRKDLLAGRH